jgi:hypothetical protein
MRIRSWMRAAHTSTEPPIASAPVPELLLLLVPLSMLDACSYKKNRRCIRGCEPREESQGNHTTNAKARPGS